MTLNSRDRRSIRLRGYDYSERGAYFVTVCTRNRECLFGAVKDGKMVVNEAGQIVSRIWHTLPNPFPSIEMDAFLVMPNHIHGLIIIVGSSLAPPKGAASSAPTSTTTLGRIIRAFKSLSAIEVNRGVRRAGKPLWQRNYYEHIIRSGEDLDDIRRYIADNPLFWAMDRKIPVC